MYINMKKIGLFATVAFMGLHLHAAGAAGAGEPENRIDAMVRAVAGLSPEEAGAAMANMVSAVTREDIASFSPLNTFLHSQRGTTALSDLVTSAENSRLGEAFESGEISAADFLSRGMHMVEGVLNATLPAESSVIYQSALDGAGMATMAQMLETLRAARPATGVQRAGNPSDFAALLRSNAWNPDAAARPAPAPAVARPADAPTPPKNPVFAAAATTHTADISVKALIERNQKEAAETRADGEACKRAVQLGKEADALRLAKRYEEGLALTANALEQENLALSQAETPREQIRALRLRDRASISLGTFKMALQMERDKKRWLNSFGIAEETVARPTAAEARPSPAPAVARPPVGEDRPAAAHIADIRIGAEEEKFCAQNRREGKEDLERAREHFFAGRHEEAIATALIALEKAEDAFSRAKTPKEKQSASYIINAAEVILGLRH